MAARKIPTDFNPNVLVARMLCDAYDSKSTVSKQQDHEQMPKRVKQHIAVVDAGEQVKAS